MTQQLQSEKFVRSCNGFFSCTAALVLMLAMSTALWANPMQLKCGRTITQADFPQYDHATAMLIQKDLAYIYHNDPQFIEAFGHLRNKSNTSLLNDATTGPVTLGWLNRFCDDMAIQVPVDMSEHDFTALVIKELKHFTPIAKAFPDWRSILLSEEFAYWLDSQTETRRRDIYKIWRSGTAEQIIWLLRQFPLAEMQSQQLTGAEDYTISYQLTQAAAKKLKKQKAIIEKLTTLLDKPFRQQEDLWLAFKAIAQDLITQPEVSRSLILYDVPAQKSWQLTDKSFEQLRLASLEDEILKPLEKLKNLPFEEKPLLRTAINKRFFQLNKQAQAQAKEQGAEPPKSLTPKVSEIINMSEHVTTYTLTQQALDNVKTSLGGNDLPAGLLKLITPLVNVDFARKNLFATAYIETLNALYLQFQQVISAEVDQLGNTSVTANFLTKLKDKQVPDVIIEKLKALQDQQFSNKQEFVQALNTNMELVFSAYRASQAEITTLVRQQHSHNEMQDVSWKGVSCGCRLDDLSGEVYSFYPFWMATDKKQQMDFSVLSRIGYYAVSFDAQGNLTRDRNWSSSHADFVNQARKRRTKVDLVVYKNWKEFSLQAKADNTLINTVTTNLVNAINEKVTDSLFDLLKPLISFGAQSVPTLGDGITLYLDGYLVDSAESDLFVAFIKTLRSKLKAANHKFALNLLMPMTAINSSPASKDTWNQLIPGISEFQDGYAKQNSIDMLLVFIPEANDHSNRILRQTIENIFTEEHSPNMDIIAVKRRNMLRKVVPVINYANQKQAPLKADMTYFEDNFGGIGFWPIVITADAKKKASAGITTLSINDLLKTNYVMGSADKHSSKFFLLEYVQKQFNNSVLAVKNFVCVNRWGFRLLFDISLILLFIAAYLYLYKCYRRCSWCLAGAFLFTLFTFLLILFFDPAYNAIAQGNGFAIFLIIVITAMLAYYMYKKREQLP